MASPDFSGLTVDLLRRIFRHLMRWQSVYEADQVDVIRGPEGEYHISDIQFLYDLSQKVLPARQSQAIRLCLYHNATEEEAADIMHIDVSNPVAMYATAGLEYLVHMVQVHTLPSRAKFYGFHSKSSNVSRDWSRVRRIVDQDPRLTPFFSSEVPVWSDSTAGPVEVQYSIEITELESSEPEGSEPSCFGDDSDEKRDPELGVPFSASANNSMVFE